MRIGGLFAGIGGLELGLERAGVGHTVWQVEIDPFCRSVLARRWPDAVRVGDVHNVREGAQASIDVLCGGFPCQDLSLAGKGEGLNGKKSGLWWEYARLIREIRPRFVVLENVAAILSRGVGDVFGELAALGYDAWWDCIPAASVGAPHQRDRWFCIAWRQDLADTDRSGGDNRLRLPAIARDGLSDTDRGGRSGTGQAEGVADTMRAGWQERHAAAIATVAGHATRRAIADIAARSPWAAPPDKSGVGRAADGLPAGVDRWELGVPRLAVGRHCEVKPRLRALGNAVVPQVAEVIGHVLLAIDAELARLRDEG